MSAAQIAKIERIPLREVWRHEARDFTTWLADNLDELSKVIGPELSLVRREANAGNFLLDLLAEDEHGQPVVIENQLGRSDHDHLGKLLVYLAAFEAKTAVWIVGEPRPEHTKVIAWLNDSTPNDFYLLRAEAVRIVGSPSALLLTPIVGPSDEARLVSETKRAQSEDHGIKVKFWFHLLDLATGKTKLHSNTTPIEQNWLPQGAGRTGLSFNYVAKRDQWRVELYIDAGDAHVNRAYFDFLEQHRSEIETRFGRPLDWQGLPEKRACRVTTEWASGGYQSPESNWTAIAETMIDSMIKLEHAIRQFIVRLPAASTLLQSEPEENHG